MPAPVYPADRAIGPGHPVFEVDVAPLGQAVIQGRFELADVLGMYPVKSVLIRQRDIPWV
jgi:hypothetical protein